MYQSLRRFDERADEDASINACMDHGAPDIDTAMRWLEQADIHAEWAVIETVQCWTKIAARLAITFKRTIQCINVM